MFKRISALVICLVMVMTGMVFVEASAPSKIEAPNNLTVEVKNREDGQPYFELTVGVPASVQTLGQNAEENDANLFYEIDYKVGDRDWESTGAVHSSGGPVVLMEADDMGLSEEIDIKANTYFFRARFGYYYSEGEDEYGNQIAADPVYSPYSKTASTSITAFKKSYKEASTWAVPELDKAMEYGLITDTIMDKMNGPITREEFAEVAVKLYEKATGKTAAYKDMSAFTDTKNPEIFKAYELGIISGMGAKKAAPKNLINREQISSMMMRAVKAVNPDADFSIEGAEAFKDEKLISSWALTSMKFMNKNGFMKILNGNINPKGTTTREQAVLMVVRIYEKYCK